MSVTVRYAIGIGCIAGPFFIWCMANKSADALHVFGAFGAVTVCTGGATLLAYLVDKARLSDVRGADLDARGVGDGQD